MKIMVSGKNIQVSPKTKAHIEKKVGKLARYFSQDIEAQVTLSTEHYRQIVEVTIPFDGSVLRAEVATDDMLTSIDRVLEKLESQIYKHRTKLEKRIKAGAFQDKNLLFADQAPEEEKASVVRVKRFAVKPMSVEEAQLQIELLGHDFFVFLNAETEEVNVLYRRKDGNYGLIEPVF
jgi:putative sigma-54 modulation protein